MFKVHLIIVVSSDYLLNNFFFLKSCTNINQPKDLLESVEINDHNKGA